MPVIKVESIGKVQKGKARLTEVTGTKIDGSGDWKGSFYSSDTQLQEELSEFGKGDTVNVRMEKNARGYWDVKHFEEADADLIEKIKGKGSGSPKQYGGGSQSHVVAKSGGMSKEEWAAKDKATKESIARAVAVKLANDNTKLGTKTSAIIDMATEFLPFLLDEEEDLNADADPLDPPDVD